MIVLAQHPATPDVPAPAVVRTVAISDVGFSPGALVVAPGTTVTWTNGGRNRHTVTAEGGFGRLRIELENVPSENPRTGKLSYLSTIAYLRDLGAPLRVGT